MNYILSQHPLYLFILKIISSQLMLLLSYQWINKKISCASLHTIVQLHSFSGNGKACITIQTYILTTILAIVPSQIIHGKSLEHIGMGKPIFPCQLILPSIHSENWGKNMILYLQYNSWIIHITKISKPSFHKKICQLCTSIYLYLVVA